MKLLRYGPQGAEKPGLLDAGGKIRDLSGLVGDIGGATLSDEGLDRLRKLDTAKLPEVDPSVRLGPCVAGPASSSASASTTPTTPPRPALRSRRADHLHEGDQRDRGPNDDVIIPRGSVEDRLGGRARRRHRQAAPNTSRRPTRCDHVAGYCVVNDVSERDFQTERSGQWDKGQGRRHFGPIGPWLVTPTKSPTRRSCRCGSRSTASRCQDGSTATMVFGVAVPRQLPQPVHELSPGDIISTGTPPGVGMGMKPPTSS